MAVIMLEYEWVEHFQAVATGHSVVGRVSSETSLRPGFKGPESYPRLIAFVGWSEGKYELL